MKFSQNIAEAFNLNYNSVLECRNNFNLIWCVQEQLINDHYIYFCVVYTAA